MTEIGVTAMPRESNREMFSTSGSTIRLLALMLKLWCVFPGNGYIPTSSLREILRELDEQLTEDELDGLIQEIDTDGSGTVDFDG